MSEFRQINGMWFPARDQHFDHQIGINPTVKGKGTYQFRKYKAAMDLLPAENRQVAVDIGAHVGLWARLMAGHFNRVECFEPLPEHIVCFNMNMEGFNNVRLHRVALGAKPGHARILSPSDNTGNTHVAAKDEVADGAVVADVEVKTLDAFNLYERIDFLKIDVEGFESEVLKGGAITIKRTKPLMVIEQKPLNNAERYGRERFEALDMLKSWGGKVHWEVGGDFCVGW